jgi:hypothetical protein
MEGALNSTAGCSSRHGAVEQGGTEEQRPPAPPNCDYIMSIRHLLVPSLHTLPLPFSSLTPVLCCCCLLVIAGEGSCGRPATSGCDHGLFCAHLTHECLLCTLGGHTVHAQGMLRFLHRILHVWMPASDWKPVSHSSAGYLLCFSVPVCRNKGLQVGTPTQPCPRMTGTECSRGKPYIGLLL